MFPAGTSHRERRNLGSFRSHCATVVKEFTQFEVKRLRTGRSMKVQNSKISLETCLPSSSPDT
jgi:hypothetical protein